MKVSGLILLAAFVGSLLFVPVGVTGVESGPSMYTLNVCSTSIAGVPVTEMPVIIGQNPEPQLLVVSGTILQSFSFLKTVLITEISQPPRFI